MFKTLPTASIFTNRLRNLENPLGRRTTPIRDGHTTTPRSIEIKIGHGRKSHVSHRPMGEMGNARKLRIEDRFTSWPPRNSISKMTNLGRSTTSQIFNPPPIEGARKPMGEYRTREFSNLPSNMPPDVRVTLHQTELPAQSVFRPDFTQPINDSFYPNLSPNAGKKFEELRIDSRVGNGGKKRKGKKLRLLKLGHKRRGRKGKSSTDKSIVETSDESTAAPLYYWKGNYNNDDSRLGAEIIDGRANRQSTQILSDHNLRRGLSEENFRQLTVGELFQRLRPDNQFYWNRNSETDHDLTEFQNYPSNIERKEPSLGLPSSSSSLSWSSNVERKNSSVALPGSSSSSSSSSLTARVPLAPAAAASSKASWPQGSTNFMDHISSLHRKEVFPIKDDDDSTEHREFSGDQFFSTEIRPPIDNSEGDLLANFRPRNFIRPKVTEDYLATQHSPSETELGWAGGRSHKRKPQRNYEIASLTTDSRAEIELPPPKRGTISSVSTTGVVFDDTNDNKITNVSQSKSQHSVPPVQNATFKMEKLSHPRSVNVFDYDQYVTTSKLYRSSTAPGGKFLPPENSEPDFISTLLDMEPGLLEAYSDNPSVDTVEIDAKVDAFLARNPKLIRAAGDNAIDPASNAKALRSLLTDNPVLLKLAQNQPQIIDYFAENPKVLQNYIARPPPFLARNPEERLLGVEDNDDEMNLEEGANFIIDQMLARNYEPNIHYDIDLLKLNEIYSS